MRSVLGPRSPRVREIRGRRTDLAHVPSKPRGFPYLENTVMRLYQRFPASFGRIFVRVVGVFLFASGIALSASGQTTPTPTPTARALQAPALPPSPVADGQPISMDEAVRMALENNLGIKQERLNPQIQTLGIARANAAFAPEFISTLSRRSSTAPPISFLEQGGGATVTNTSFFTQAGLQQALPFGGSSYGVSFDGSRAVSNAARVSFSPQLGSNLNAQFVQPCL